MFFKNRHDAGEKLARVFTDTGRDFSGFEVAGIARGGVIIAEPIARTLGLKLHALCVEDLETAEGTLVITSFGSGTWFWHDQNKRPTRISDVGTLRLAGLPGVLETIARKDRLFGVAPFTICQKVILCDDGIVSGKSAFAAINSLRNYGVREIILGIPVSPPWLVNMKRDFELVTWRKTMMKFPTTGMFYLGFDDTPDEDVVRAIHGQLLPI